MAEYLDHLRTAYCLLNVTFRLTYRLLLLEEILGASSTDKSGDNCHRSNSQQYYGSHIHTVIQHYTHYCNYHHGSIEYLRKTLGYHLTKCIYIIRIQAHGVSHGFAVKKLYWKHLHFVEEFSSHFLESSLGDRCHHLVKCNSSRKGNHIHGNENGNISEYLASDACPIPTLI